MSEVLLQPAATLPGQRPAGRSREGRPRADRARHSRRVRCRRGGFAPSVGRGPAGDRAVSMPRRSSPRSTAIHRDPPRSTARHAAPRRPMVRLRGHLDSVTPPPDRCRRPPPRGRCHRPTSRGHPAPIGRHATPRWQTVGHSRLRRSAANCVRFLSSSMLTRSDTVRRGPCRPVRLATLARAWLTAAGCRSME